MPNKPDLLSSTPAIYLILEQAGDYQRLKRHLPAGKSHLCVPVSAIAMADVSRLSPAPPTLGLDALTHHEEIIHAIARQRDFLWQSLLAREQLPLYKLKLLLDSFAEKAAIADILAQLPGEKWFVGQRVRALSLFEFLPETFRSIAAALQGREGFYAYETQTLPMAKTWLRSIARLAVKSWRARRSSFSPHAPIAYNIGYGIERDLSSPYWCWDESGGWAIWRAKMALHKRLRLLWQFLLLYRPLRFSPNDPMCGGLLSGLLARYATARYIVASVWDGNALTPPYVFGVTYTSLLANALVAEARVRGVKVHSMQHAAVGHDEWLGVRYSDAFLSDVKYVATPKVAESLSQFEGAPSHCAYVPARLPHLNAMAPELKPWDGNTLVYIATGFVRNNIMYDQRRLNDCLYYAQMREKLLQLAPAFSLSLKPHPHDQTQALHGITESLAAQAGIALNHTPARELAAAVIDSPSTVLADLTLAGVPVFILNATCHLRPEFVALAQSTGVLQESAAALIAYLAQTPMAQIRAGQSRFREEFCRDYLLNPSAPSPAQIMQAAA